MNVRKAILAALIVLAVPATAFADAPGTTLTGSGPTFSFSSTEPGATFECSVDGGAFDACVSPYTVKLADGPHTFAVRAVDGAGNADPTPATRDFDIDTSGIETTIDAGPEGLTNDPTPTYAFSTTTTSASYECRIAPVANWAPCVSPLELPRLSSGAYTFEVRAVGPDGRKDGSPARRAFTLDADAPETTLTGGPGEGDTTTIRAPAFAYTSNEPGTFECRADPQTKNDVELVAWAPCAPLKPLTGGPHAFEVRAVDTAGNPDPTPSKRTFKVLACEQVVRFQLIEARGSCIEQDGNTYTSASDITLNGLPIPAAGGAKIQLTDAEDASKVTLKGVTIDVAGVQLYKGDLSFNVPKGDAGTEKDVKAFDVANKKLFGMPIGGKALLRFGRRANSDQRYAVLALNVQLPDIFKTGVAASSTAVTGDVAIRMDPVDGVQLDGLKVDVGNAYVGALVVKKLCLSYLRAGATFTSGCTAPTVGGTASKPFIECAVDTQVDRWDGALAIVLPTASKTEIGMWGGLSAGRFSHAGAYVDNLGNLVPLAPGVFLNRVALGVCVDPPPFKVKGEVGVGFGPDVSGKKAVAINGWFQYTDGNPWKIEAGGSVDVFGRQMADGHFSYESSGMVAFGFHAGFDFGKVAKFDGKVDGWVQTGTPNFNVEGDVSLCNKTLGCLGVYAVVSNIGLAGCAKVDTFFGSIRAGAGYTFATKNVDVMLTGCDIGPYRAKAAQAGAQTVNVGEKARAVVVRIRGNGAMPKVALVGPDGRRVSTDVPDGAGFKQGEYMIMGDEDHNAVNVLVASPAKGEWNVEPLPGSAPIAGIDVADPLPPVQLHAKLKGPGPFRLTYTRTPHPGEVVTFVERGRRTARVLGTARGAKGTIRFTPALGGAGVRNIEAVITQNGKPRETRKVASFIAPADALPKRPKVTVKRVGNAVRVSWKGSDHVDVTVRTGDGASRLLAGRKPRGVVRIAARRQTKVVVTVRGVRADGRAGAPTTRRLNGRTR